MGALADTDAGVLLLAAGNVPRSGLGKDDTGPGPDPDPDPAVNKAQLAQGVPVAIAGEEQSAVVAVLQTSSENMPLHWGLGHIVADIDHQEARTAAALGLGSSHPVIELYTAVVVVAVVVAAAAVAAAVS